MRRKLPLGLLPDVSTFALVVFLGVLVLAAVRYFSRCSSALAAEPPTPVDARALKKAFTAPKSIVDFFKPRAGAAAGAAALRAANGSAVAAAAVAAAAGQAAAAGVAAASVTQKESVTVAVGHKRVTAEAAAAPAAKRHAANKSGSGAKGGIAAAFCRSQQQQQQVPREQQGPGPAPLVDLAAEDDGSCDAGGLRAAAGTTNDVLRASTRLNGSSGSEGAAGRGQEAAAKRPGSGGRLDPAAVQALTAMGFTGQQAERALRVTCGDIERAANWILTGS